MKILNFGSCNLDFVYTLDHIVMPGETEATDAYEVFAGGKGLNQSVAAARAGAMAYHAGCVGNNGEMLRQILEESGVDTTFLETVDSANGHAIIQVSRKGENAIFLYPGSNEKITEEQIDRALQPFAAGDFLLLQNETNLVPYAVRRGAERGMKVVLNPSPFNEKIREIDFSLLSYLILNEVEGKALTGSDDPRECIGLLRKQYPNLAVVLTLGKEGSIFCDGSGTFYQPAYRVCVVDTTAAGDTFTGYFLSSLADGDSCADGLRIASAASALAVSRMGAAPSIPRKEEVLAALATLTPYGKDESEEQELRNRIERYLGSHLRDASLSGLATSLGYSAAYTGNLVKKHFAMPFSVLLLRIRCGKAAELLEKTDLSIEDIIDYVGYKNESFFRKAFRDRYACSPRNYRNMKRGSKDDA